jgi:hypothetical protein
VLTVRLRLPPARYRTPFDKLGPYVPGTAVAVVALAALAGSGAAGGKFTRIRVRGYCGTATSGVDRASVQ